MSLPVRRKQGGTHVRLFTQLWQVSHLCSQPACLWVPITLPPAGWLEYIRLKPMPEDPAEVESQQAAASMPGSGDGDSPWWSASEAQEEGVAALSAVRWVVLVVKVQDVLLGLEAEPLVQQHGSVAGRHVQRHVLPHACLKARGRQSEDESATSCPAPLSSWC